MSNGDIVEREVGDLIDRLRTAEPAHPNCPLGLASRDANVLALRMGEIALSSIRKIHVYCIIFVVVGLRQDIWEALKWGIDKVTGN